LIILAPSELAYPAEDEDEEEGAEEDEAKWSVFSNLRTRETMFPKLSKKR